MPLVPAIGYSVKEDNWSVGGLAGGYKVPFDFFVVSGGGDEVVGECHAVEDFGGAV